MPKRLDELDARLAAVAAHTRAGFAERARAIREAADTFERGAATDELRRLVHQLRGIAGSAGHPELSEQAARLEEAWAGAGRAQIANGARELAGAAEAAAPRRPEISAPQKLGWRVLAVDDDASVRRLLEVVLAQVGGCEVTLLADPRQALGALRAADFDLVILDAMMPDLNGLELYEGVRREAPHVAVAILSASQPYELGWTLPDDPRLRWIRKPFRAASLFDELRVLAIPTR